MKRKTISVIGGGPSALLLAAFIDSNQYDLTVYEMNKTPGRKFLVAGDGGFNLSHGSDTAQMIKQYEPAGFMDGYLSAFSNLDLRQWLESIGIKTFVGSSNRIYPLAGIKPVQVLNAILELIDKKGIKINTSHKWIGWNEKNELLFDNKLPVKSDMTVFALGGASWKVTGSNGQWLGVFAEKQIPVLPFRASNCGFKLNWSEEFIKACEGKPLKNISLSAAGKTVKGELVVTSAGLEGNAIYALSTVIQDELLKNGMAVISIDFKPMWSLSEVISKLNEESKGNIQERLQKSLNIGASAIKLLKSVLSKTEYTNPETLAAAVKQLPLQITGSSDIDEAISSTGGIDLEAIDKHFQLKHLPGHFCIGEMLNWNAPTGGYLLQACFSMGVALARYLNSLKD